MTYDIMYPMISDMVKTSIKYKLDYNARGLV